MSTGERIDLTEISGFGPVDLYQKREKIITRSVSGKYQYLRWFTGWPLLLGFFGAPHLYWEGRQAILFDLGARQFHLFGLTFWPEDLWICGALLIIGAFLLFTVTTLFGRVWCGFTCPQTVWTAMFMWIEQYAEGDRSARQKLERAPLSFNKVRRRGLKHLLWLGLAALTGLAFVSYFTPVHPLLASMVSLELSGWPLFWIAFFTLATYGNAGWLREQVCIYMCPYARFQSAMFDPDTLIVAYDAARGDPRGAKKRGVSKQTGDCVDCTICVQVCPTGIDIRNGLQYQCISCAHCVDACDEVMRKLKRPQGLISFTSERELAGGSRHWLRPRSVGYAAAVAAMAVFIVTSLALRDPLMMEIVRGRGALFQVTADGAIANEYVLKLTNKSGQPMWARVAVEPEANGDDIHLDADARWYLSPRGSILAPLRVSIADGERVGSQPLRFSVCFSRTEAGEASDCVSETNLFFAPKAVAQQSLPVSGVGS
ncbi:MAG: cytochrome c oxidase accessory protein CcoG [Pseudomonadota bacterium]